MDTSRRSWWKSIPGRLLSPEQRRGTRTVSASSPPGPAAPEAFLVDDLALAQQVVERPPEPRRQDGQAAPLAVLLVLALQPRLGPRALAHEQAGGLGEGPTQVGVADLHRPGTLLLAGRRVGAAHQPAVR
jgi:hypothetical protein